MNVSMYQAAAALNAHSRWQEIVAENLSASALPGFKKHTVSFGAIDGGQMLPGATGGPSSQSAKFALPKLSSGIDFSAGQLKHTGVNTDMAIEGEGFFEVQLPTGETALTRDGEFRVNSDGQLVTKSGLPVMGTGGKIQFDPGNKEPENIAVDGRISQGAVPVGQIRVVNPGNPQELRSVGGGLYLSRDAGLLEDVEVPSVHQGYLESSNTSPVTEMADLINSMRMFEANQKLIQLQDERMSKAINTLGNQQ